MEPINVISTVSSVIQLAITLNAVIKETVDRARDAKDECQSLVSNLHRARETLKTLEEGLRDEKSWRRVIDPSKLILGQIQEDLQHLKAHVERAGSVLGSHRIQASAWDRDSERRCVVLRETQNAIISLHSRLKLRMQVLPVLCKSYALTPCVLRRSAMFFDSDTTHTLRTTSETRALNESAPASPRAYFSAVLSARLESIRAEWPFVFDRISPLLGKLQDTRVHAWAAEKEAEHEPVAFEDSWDPSQSHRRLRRNCFRRNLAVTPLVCFIGLAATNTIAQYDALHPIRTTSVVNSSLCWEATLDLVPTNGSNGTAYLWVTEVEAISPPTPGTFVIAALTYTTVILLLYRLNKPFVYRQHVVWASIIFSVGAGLAAGADPQADLLQILPTTGLMLLVLGLWLQCLYHSHVHERKEFIQSSFA